jgi:hypothetical protein
MRNKLLTTHHSDGQEGRNEDFREILARTAFEEAGEYYGILNHE